MPRIVRFATFQADLDSGELFKDGIKLKLGGQPFQVLAFLLARPGEIVTREQLQSALWQSDTFVDFDQGLNTAINKIREALGDAAANPRFVETVPRRGYRFIAPVDPQQPSPEPPPATRKPPYRWIAITAAIAAVLAAGLVFSSSRTPPAPTQYKLTQVTRDSGLTHQPSLSADGNFVVYSSDRATGKDLDIWIQHVSGGQPVRLTSTPADESHPSLAADGRKVPAAGGIAKKTGIATQLRNAGAAGMAHLMVSADPHPAASASNDGVVLAARSGDGHDLWWSALTNGVATDPPTRITVGAAAAHPSLAASGRIAFSRLAVHSAMWMLPLHASTGRPTGALQRTGRENASMNYPNLSRDGSKLVYVSNRGGDPDVWVRDLDSGADRQLTSSKADEFRAAISPDGKLVAYSVNRDVFTIPTTGGMEKLICKSCAPNVVMWSPDGRKILTYWGQPLRHGTIDLATGQKQELVVHPTANIHSGRFSPDGRWMTFTLVSEGSRVIYITSLENGAGTKPETWIRITAAGMAQSSFWPPDANLLYIHQPDGLWARKLHPATKIPDGEPFLVRPLAGPGFAPIFSANGISSNALYFMALETTSNIWIADPMNR